MHKIGIKSYRENLYETPRKCVCITRPLWIRSIRSVQDNLDFIRFFLSTRTTPPDRLVFIEFY